MVSGVTPEKCCDVTSAETDFKVSKLCVSGVTPESGGTECQQTLLSTQRPKPGEVRTYLKPGEVRTYLKHTKLRPPEQNGGR